MPTLVEAKQKVVELSTRGLDVVESSSMTSAEKKSALDLIDVDLKHWTDEVRELGHVEEQRKRFLSGAPKVEQSAGDVEEVETRSYGQQVVDAIKAKGINPRGRFDSGTIELKTAATVGEGTLGAALITPVYRPGITELRFLPLVVADLLAQGSIDGNLLSYVKESAFTDGTATVAESGTKPYADDTFTRLTEQLGKIAVLAKLTTEMLEDSSVIQSFMSSRLVNAVGRREQSEILNGTGLPGMNGLLTRAGLATTIVQAVSPDTAADAIYRQMTQIRTVSFVEPTGIVMNPINWQKLRLSKDAQGQYYAGGPFTGAYGTGQVGNPYTLWGLPVAVTPAIAVGTALVGGFADSAQIFRRNGITVDMTNSNVNDFENNLVTMRVEERALLAVYRPSAFGLVTLL